MRCSKYLWQHYSGSLLGPLVTLLKGVAYVRVRPVRNLGLTLSFCASLSIADGLVLSRHT